MKQPEETEIMGLGSLQSILKEWKGTFWGENWGISMGETRKTGLKMNNSRVMTSALMPHAKSPTSASRADARLRGGVSVLLAGWS